MLYHPARHDPRPREHVAPRLTVRAPARLVPARLVACLCASAACLVPAAWAQSQPGAQPATVVIDAYRVAARADAAAALLAQGEPAAARTQLDEARQGPLLGIGTTEGSAGGDVAAALAQLRAAVAGGDTGGARTAARDALAAADALRSASAATPTDVVVALARDAGSEGREAADATPQEATEPRAYALALCRLAGDVAERAHLPATPRDALNALASTVRGDAGSAAVRAAAATTLAALGAAPSGQDVAATFDAIDRDLDLAVSRYRQGDAGGAQRALVDAYLDNFEGLEPALRAADAELERRLETTLAQQLRALIRDGATPERFQSAVQQARADLQSARQALR